jgi:hypothetical protein
MSRRIYLDASVLIAAWQVKDNVGAQALSILDDPDRALVVSDAVWLEVMPKPLYHKQHNEQAFYQAIFDQAEVIPWQTPTLNHARELAQRYGIAAMDAIHLALAIAAQADEFVSAEKPGKPMFRVREISIRSVRSAAP